MRSTPPLTGPVFCRRAAFTLILFGTVYVALFFLHRAFPYIGEGGNVVIQEKMRHMTSQPIFPDDADRRLVIFGNSKILSGFVPDQFDELSGNRISSYNLGIPQARRLVPYLEALIEAGNVPTDVFITLLWVNPPEKNPLVLIDNDKELIQRLVPFRHLIRDVLVFVRRSRYRGGFATLYRETESDSKDVLAQRGYYFISGQSQFPNDELPEDFRLKADTPDLPKERFEVAEGPVFDRLLSLLETHDIQAYIVPSYYRIPEYAPMPAVEPELREAFAGHPRITVLDGPAYFSYPNNLFSDRLHLNREGARVYTRGLWDLYKSHVTP